jgi:hypothetical protein
LVAQFCVGADLAFWPADLDLVDNESSRMDLLAVSLVVISAALGLGWVRTARVLARTKRDLPAREAEPSWRWTRS